MFPVFIFFMSNHPNFLRLFRKRSPLSQEDVAFLMGFPDISNVSRYEKSQRAPSIEFLLVYHHLFNTPIESFFEHHSEGVILELSSKIDDLIFELNKENDSVKNGPRINFLEEALNRLTT